MEALYSDLIFDTHIICKMILINGKIIQNSLQFEKKFLQEYVEDWVGNGFFSVLLIEISKEKVLN